MSEHPLTTELREYGAGDDPDYSLFLRAADELDRQATRITQLETALREIIMAPNGGNSRPWIELIAREALGEA